MNRPLHRIGVWVWAAGWLAAAGVAGQAAEARGTPSASPADVRPFGNPFGMQLRRAPLAASEVMAPVIVRAAPTNECAAVARRDGAIEVYFITKPASESVSLIRSRDGGVTWGEPQVAFPLPGRAYYAVKVLEAPDGAMHAVFHLLGQGPGGYRGRLYEVYHVRRAAESATWSRPQRVVPGYVGSIRGFTQLKSGRLVLGVARAIPEREPPPAAGPDLGWNDTFVYLSDDQGATWRASPDQLTLALATKNTTRYGAIEPVLLELRDGRVWMLVRDRGGRLWQSFSPDGERWPALERSPFISSDSPAELLRLRNGNILLLTNACQFWSDPRTYAMGGREVLQAALSADEGRTWRGFREILHESTGVRRGDRGSAYASAVETRDGKIVVVSGQGEGNRAIVLLDPRWLQQTETSDDLASGPVAWTQYGGGGLRVETSPDAKRALTVPLKSSGLCGALWNFPTADSGEISLQLDIPAQVSALRLCLNDHFNRINDQQAAEHAVFTVPLEQPGQPGAARTLTLHLQWNHAAEGGDLVVEVNGMPAQRIAAQRPAQFGVNYLRVEFRASVDTDRLLITNLVARNP